MTTQHETTVRHPVATVEAVEISAADGAIPKFVSVRTFDENEPSVVDAVVWTGLVAAGFGPGFAGEENGAVGTFKKGRSQGIMAFAAIGLLPNLISLSIQPQEPRIAASP